MAIIARYLRAVFFSALIAVGVNGAHAQDAASGFSVYVVDSGGRLSQVLEIGASLETGARGLRPRRMHEFELTLEGRRVSFARLMSDSRGEINSFILWFQSGVIGCSIESVKTHQRYPIEFRDFDDAERALRGKKLTLKSFRANCDTTRLASTGALSIMGLPPGRSAGGS